MRPGIKFVLLMALGLGLSLMAQAFPFGSKAASAQTAAPKSSKKLIIAYQAEPESLIPNACKVMSPVSIPVAENLSECIIGIRPDGERVPGIASWKVSSDGKEIEFTLRKGVKFHSGDPLTTKDVEFSYKLGVQGSTTVARAMRYVERLQIIDDYRIKFHFKRPDVTFLPRRALYIDSKSYYDRVGKDQFLKQPVGTGPYKFVSWKPGEYIDLEANEEYWGGAPSVKQVRFVFAREDTTRVAMLRTGEADLITECPYSLVGNLEQARFKTEKVTAHPSCSLQFHCSNPKVPWFDRRVRLACAYAIDANAIAKNLFQGIPGRYARLAPWELGYDPDLKPYPYDPKKARELLAEAGYPKGFEMPLYYFLGRGTGQKETVEAVSLYLNAVGIKCNVQGIEAVTFMQKMRGEWEVSPNAVFAAVSTVPATAWADPILALEQPAYYSRQEKTAYLYANPECDALIEEARKTMNDAKRGELIRKIYRIIHEDAPTALLWAHNSVYVMKRNIDFTPTVRANYALILVKDVRVRD